jgi:hypothetical protein
MTTTAASRPVSTIRLALYALILAAGLPGCANYGFQFANSEAGQRTTMNTGIDPVERARINSVYVH